MPNIYLISLGCDKNRVDGETMIGTLRASGYQVVNDPDIAHGIIVNTCGFIKDAVEESIQLILELSDHKQNGICRGLIVVGCMAQRYAKEIKEAIPEVDLIIGVGKYESIGHAIEETIGKPENTPSIEDIKYARIKARADDATPHIAYVKIAEGCDNHCTYCTIPSIRGPYQSRPLEDILEESQALVSLGTREIVLVAQDTSLYGTDIYGEKKLPELLEQLSLIKNLTWIRVMYLYPEHITDTLLDTIQHTANVVNYVDMPLQHTEISVLKRMGRQGTQLENLVQTLKDRHIAIRTTLIVGFPGETEAEFEAISQFVKEAEFDRLGVFPYSQEDGTPAANMPNQIDDQTKLARLEKIMDMQQRIHFKKQENMVGQIIPVMIDVMNDGMDHATYIGRTSQDAYEVDTIVTIKSTHPLQIGHVYPIKITAADLYDLGGEYEPAE